MWSRIRSYIVWIASGVALNGLLFVLGTAIGAFGPSVLAKTTQQPLSIAPVIAASIFPAVIATAIRLVVGRLVRPWSRAQKYWRNITVLLLLLSFGSPVQGLSGHNTLSVVILCAMHVVSAVTIFMGLSWITRPRWTFGSDWSPKVTGNGELAVVTGATSGIGKAVALQLHDLGFNVVGVGRSATFPSAEMETSPRYRLITADLSSVKNAVQAGQSVVEFDNRPVHLVVHCAGTLKATTKQTEDGIDENFATRRRTVSTRTSRLHSSDDWRSPLRSRPTNRHDSLRERALVKRHAEAYKLNRGHRNRTPGSRESPACKRPLVDRADQEVRISSFRIWSRFRHIEYPPGSAKADRKGDGRFLRACHSTGQRRSKRHRQRRSKRHRSATSR